MTEPMTPKRLAELKQLAGPSEEEWLEVLIALDAERAAHRETRAEVEQLKSDSFHVSSCNTCGTTVMPGDECRGCRRDQARRDAVHLWDILEGSDDDVGDLLPSRIVAYRKALDAAPPRKK